MLGWRTAQCHSRTRDRTFRVSTTKMAQPRCPGEVQAVLSSLTQEEHFITKVGPKEMDKLLSDTVLRVSQVITNNAAPILQMRKQIRKQNYLLKVTQLGSGRAKTWMQCLGPKAMFSHYTHVP